MNDKFKNERNIFFEQLKKNIFNKCGTNIYFFTLQKFGPLPSPNFKCYVSNFSFMVLILYINRKHKLNQEIF